MFVRPAHQLTNSFFSLIWQRRGYIIAVIFLIDPVKHRLYVIRNGLLVPDSPVSEGSLASPYDDYLNLVTILSSRLFKCLVESIA